ncbi:hypothetical protein KKH3_21200 [Pectobacterium actinidiae]|nr:hypothetical protein KKH3_21200 [Pectobacterium actinidiae]
MSFYDGAFLYSFIMNISANKICYSYLFFTSLCNILLILFFAIAVVFIMTIYCCE